MRPHLIMPMGGAGSRFFDNGYVLPKPLIEIHEKPFLYWATKSITKFVDVADITFVVLQQHIDEHKIDEVIRGYFPDACIKVLPGILPGPVFTALKGVEDIIDDGPIVFNDCDHMFKSSALNQLLTDGFDLDGALVTFKSNGAQFSYVKYDEQSNVVGTIEKKVVSDHAICGAYVFRNAELFKDISRIYVDNCPYNECFMSGLYNVMCSMNMKIKDYLLDFHVEFGTPEEYEIARESKWFSVID